MQSITIFKPVKIKKRRRKRSGFCCLGFYFFCFRDIIKAKQLFSKIFFRERARTMLYDYLLEKYGKNEPIFISELEIEGVTKNVLRQQIKKLTDAGKLKRYDTGVYFIPEYLVFKSWETWSTLSPVQVIEKKYLRNEDKVFGYWSGYIFVNMMKLTTQCPVIYEVVSNNTTTGYRKIMINRTTVIVRSPKIKITEKNVNALQFLDLINDVAVYAEVEGRKLKKKIREIMKEMKVTFKALEPYLGYYPEKIYKNMYKTGVIKNVFA